MHRAKVDGVWKTLASDGSPINGLPSHWAHVETIWRQGKGWIRTKKPLKGNLSRINNLQVVDSDGFK